MSDFVHNLSINLYAESDDDTNNYIKEQIQLAIDNFQLTIEQIPYILGVSSEKIRKIFYDEPCDLDHLEEALISQRLIFLSTGFSSIDEKERIICIINILVNEFHFTHENLAKYANIPYEAFKDFYNNDLQIETSYVLKICVNIQMLYFILNNNPTIN